jgi:hypothetical protein
VVRDNFLRKRAYREHTEGSVNAVLVAGYNEVAATVAFFSLFHREPNVIVEDFLNGATEVGNFSGAFEPLN